MTRLVTYLRERAAARMRMLGLLPAAGWRLLSVGVALQLVAGIAPVAFILATSTVVGRVPGAVERGVDSAEWRGLRNALLVAAVVFVTHQVLAPLQHACGWMLAERIDDRLRERAARASFGPIGIAAIEEPETFDMLADLADTDRGTGFTPGWASWASLLLFGMYLQTALAAVEVPDAVEPHEHGAPAVSTKP